MRSSQNYLIRSVARRSPVVLPCVALIGALAAGAPSASSAALAIRLQTHRARASSARPAPVQSGPRARASIIGGTEAANGTFPWLAFVIYKSAEGVDLCTGTVISANVILTAGHCGEDAETGVVNEPSGYAVVTGNVEWSSSAREVSGVSKVLIYPGYARSYAVGDAALLVLSTSTTAPAISLASWPSDSTDLEAGRAAVLAGWGNTYFGQEEPTERLRWAETVLQKPSYCEAAAPTFFPGDELCVINPPEYETGACHGDSGGPLISLNPSGSELIEIGVISHGNDECSTESPTVLTRADLIASWAHDWIEAVKPAPPPAPPPPRPPAPTPPPAPVTRAPTAAAPWAPPNTPGLYVTPRSKAGRRIMARVSGDGAHLVGIGVKTTLSCQHGYSYEVDESALSYRDSAPITNHVATLTVETYADRYMRSGRIGLFLFFNRAGSLEGRARVWIRSKNRHVGVCSGSLSFKAKV
jgi:secreted trypsin-like serine protease